MFKPWPRLIKRIRGPRLWAYLDRSNRNPAIIIEKVSLEKYSVTIGHLARLSDLTLVAPSRYEAPLLDQIADTMINLAFFNRHGTPDEGFVEPSHWPKG